MGFTIIFIQLLVVLVVVIKLNEIYGTVLKLYNTVTTIKNDCITMQVHTFLWIGAKLYRVDCRNIELVCLSDKWLHHIIK